MRKLFEIKISISKQLTWPNEMGILFKALHQTATRCNDSHLVSDVLNLSVFEDKHTPALKLEELIDLQQVTIHELGAKYERIIFLERQQRQLLDCSSPDCS